MGGRRPLRNSIPRPSRSLWIGQLSCTLIESQSVVGWPFESNQRQHFQIAFSIGRNEWDEANLKTRKSAPAGCGALLRRCLLDIAPISDCAKMQVRERERESAYTSFFVIGGTVACCPAFAMNVHIARQP